MSSAFPLEPRDGWPIRYWKPVELGDLRYMRRFEDADLDLCAEHFGCSRGEIDRACWALLGATPDDAAAELNCRPALQAQGRRDAGIGGFLRELFGRAS